jgi:branched-chain amino acid transport system substrate-binding protein
VTPTQFGSRNRLAVSALLLIGGMLASCSGSGSGNGGFSGSTGSNVVGVGLADADASQAAISQLGPVKVPSGATTRGISGKVITIGGVATIKDSTGVENYPGVCDGAKARFARANREGGVNGYTFNYVGCTDDGQNPQTNRDATQDMVTSKHVFALVPYTSGVSNQGAYLNQQRVPYLGWGISTDYCGWSDRQFGFSVTSAISCTSATGNKAFFSSVGISAYLAATKKAPSSVKAAFVGTGDHATVVSISAFRKIGKALGLDVVYAKTPLPGAGAPPLSDYTPIAQDVIASGANFVAIPTNPNVLFGLIGALKAGGYTGDIEMFFADSRLAALAGQLDKVYAMTPNFGSPQFPGAQWNAIKADLAAIGSKAPLDGSGTITSYASADLLIKAIGEVKGAVTAEAVSKVINGGGFSYQPAGNVICPSTWPAAHVVPSNCAAMVQFSGSTKSIVPVKDLAVYGKDYLFPLSAN